MKRIWLYAWANIRRSKGHTISFLIIIMLAMTMLTAGVVTYMDCTANFDRRSDELHSGHGLFAMENKHYRKDLMDAIKNSDQVTDSQVQDVIMSKVKCKYGSGMQMITMVMWNKGDSLHIGRWEMVEQREETPSGNEIYLPLIFKTGGGYKLGDTFRMTLGTQTYEYKIQGFFEHIFLGSSPTLGAMVGPDSYRQITKDLNGRANGKMIVYELRDRENATNFSANLFSKYDQNADEDEMVIRLSYVEIRYSRIFMAQLIAIMVVAFALIILAITLIVIRFRIINCIEEDIKNIGALKAMGYTSGDLMMSYLMQFAGISVGGILCGIALARGLLPYMGKALEAQSGMVWTIQSPVFVEILLGLALLLIVASTVILTARRVRRLSAITALRNGMSSHSFRKNHFAFETTRGSGNWIMALKNMVTRPSQNIMICFIVTMLTFTSMFVYTLYYNMSVDRQGFVDAVAGEVPSIQITINNSVKDFDMVDEMAKDSRVKQTLWWTHQSVVVGGNTLFAYVCDDFSKVTTNMCYEGRSPIHDNEIAIGGLGAKMMKKKVGDEIEIKMGDITESYLITGLIQSGNNMGFDGELTVDGIKRVMPNWMNRTLNVYLKEGTDTDQFIKDVENKYKTQVSLVMSIDELLDAQMGAYQNITSLLSVVILVLSCSVIALILFLVLKTMIIRNKKNLGIQKAMGYTTFQLVVQMGMAMTPVIFLGTLIGFLMGVFLTNPLCSVLLQSIGMMRLKLRIQVFDFGLISIGLVIFSFLVALLISVRIRNISARSLIQE